jgi:hypothetical protein
MSTSELSSQRRQEVRWGIRLPPLLLVSAGNPFFAFMMYAFGKVSLPPEKTLYYVAAILFGVSFVAVVGTYCWVLVRAKCSQCGWMLLRNPKGLGPSDFIFHPSCPGGSAHVFGLRFLPSYRINPWMVQMMRAKNEKRLRCLRCGTDYDVGTGAQ